VWGILILPIYWATWLGARLAFWFFWRYRVLAGHKLPRQGPFILAANHRSNAEPALLGCTPWRRNYFFAKRELFDKPLFGRYIRSLGAFPVDRGNADLGAMRVALDVLKRGHVLIFFPEGTRSETDAFLPAQPGLGMIALRSGAPVIPAYVSGSQAAVGHLWPRRPVRALIGDAIDPLGVDLPKGRAGYQAFSNLVLDRIKELATVLEFEGARFRKETQVESFKEESV
jgi:1-acyl-sn-glycerol-3-phosphate acyltransferase